LAVFINDPTDAERDLIDNVSKAWWFGFSATIGLLGGKALP
jgi:hypothetical protein